MPWSPQTNVMAWWVVDMLLPYILLHVCTFLWFNVHFPRRHVFFYKIRYVPSKCVGKTILLVYYVDAVCIFSLFALV